MYFRLCKTNQLFIATQPHKYNIPINSIYIIKKKSYYLCRYFIFFFFTDKTKLIRYTNRKFGRHVFVYMKSVPSVFFYSVTVPDAGINELYIMIMIVQFLVGTLN